MLVKPSTDQRLDSLRAKKPSGEFGYKVEDGKAVFRLHAPRAVGVELLIYEDVSIKEPVRYPLQSEEEGSWIVRLKRNMDGYWYRFAVTNRDHLGNPFTKLITDPYAGQWWDGMVLGLHWEIKASQEPFVPPPIEEIVIVEAHLRDLLHNAGLELKPEERQNLRSYQLVEIRRLLPEETWSECGGVTTDPGI